MSEWRPIESAPKDGTTVLLSSRYGEMAVGWWWHRDGGRWINAGVCQPTHWMPLPSPPSMEEESE